MTGLPWLETASLFASGSDALARLVLWGAREHGWRRVWLPSYYCPDVPSALMVATGGEVELRWYPDADLWAKADLRPIPAEPGDVVVTANQLGVRVRPETAALEARRAVIIEDHSHDLASAWALGSTAAYAFASLRKTLPLPDGGAVWSPRGLPLPPEPDDAPDREVDGGDAPRLSAGEGVDRVAAALAERQRRLPPADDRLRFLALARTAAAPTGSSRRRGISPVSRALLPPMPVPAWRERRRRNLAVLAQAAAAVTDARILDAPEGGVSFALTLVFASVETRRAAQAALIARAVVPTILWPLAAGRDPGVASDDADLARRILSIHGDQRYDDADIRQLAGIMREALQA